MRIRLVKTAAGSIHDGVLPVFVMHLSGLLDSNQRPRAPQTCALPTALNPDLRLQRYGVFSKQPNFWLTFSVFTP